MTTPSYIALPAGDLARRGEEAVASLAACRLCPRDCGVDRLRNEWSACWTGRHAVVNSCFPHFGEEDCLRGWNGSGTIFFAHCNLRCVFCQNYEISQGHKPQPDPVGVPPDSLARMMLELQSLGCHNINFVTPEHVVPQVLESLAVAVHRGLRLPIVYNTSAYDSIESLRFMDGVVDIYMPDMKFWSADASKRYLKAADYPEVARAVIREMYRQVGPLEIDGNGLATRGVLIRHLVMPGFVHESISILTWIREEFGPGAYVNLMDQYRPAGHVGDHRFSELDRRVMTEEYSEAVQVALDLGLRLDSRRARIARA